MALSNGIIAVARIESHASSGQTMTDLLTTPEWSVHSARSVHQRDNYQVTDNYRTLTLREMTPSHYKLSFVKCYTSLNPCSAKIDYLHFHPLEVVSRYRDSQLQVGENVLYLYYLNENT